MKLELGTIVLDTQISRIGNYCVGYSNIQNRLISISTVDTSIQGSIKYYTFPLPSGILKKDKINLQMNKDRYQALISIFTIQVFPDLISKLEGDATDLKGPTGKDGFKVGKVKKQSF